MTWRRGEFDVDTYVEALRVRTGYVSSCGTWGIERLPRGSWSLTHLLTGRKVASARTLTEAKELAGKLSPLVDAVRLDELSDALGIADALVDAIGDTMRAWVRR